MRYKIKESRIRKVLPSTNVEEIMWSLEFVQHSEMFPYRVYILIYKSDHERHQCRPHNGGGQAKVGSVLHRTPLVTSASASQPSRLTLWESEPGLGGEGMSPVLVHQMHAVHSSRAEEI